MSLYEGVVVVEDVAPCREYVISPNRNLIMHGVKLHLARIGNPSGTLSLQVLTEIGGNVIAESDEVAMENIGSANPSDPWHGYVPFSAQCGIAANTGYILQLGVGGSYVYSDSDHIAWLREIGSPRYQGAFFDFEIWEKKLITKGAYP